MFGENFCSTTPFYDELDVKEFDEEDELDNEDIFFKVTFENVPTDASGGFLEFFGILDLESSSEFAIYSEENNIMFYSVGNQNDDCESYSVLIPLNSTDLLMWASAGVVEFNVQLTDEVNFFYVVEYNEVFGDKIFSRLVVCQVGVVNIPTLSTWAILVLLLLLTIIGVNALLAGNFASQRK